jgi:hypothetical protein
LGMVDLAVQEGKVQAFRLTPLGAHCLQPDKYPYSMEPPAEGSAEWLEDGTTIKITPGLGINQLRGLVSRVAVPVTGEANVYRLGGAGVEKAFLQGDAPELLATQFAALGYPLPAAAQAYLAQLYARFGRVHLYEGVTVVEFTDDTAVAELRAANLLPHNVILAQLSPRLIVIPEPFANTLLQNLEQKGYTPRMVAGAN